MTRRIRLSFHGAAGTVTGSKHLLEVDDQRILVDAGMFQGKKTLRLKNWEGPGFDPRTIDRVLLTHTHIDHVGYLPRLVRLGLTAPVHLTPAANELAEIMLLDAAKIQEEDARHANKKGYTKHRPALPLYDADDARTALELRRVQPYRRWLDLGSVRARFENSGHLLGAAFLDVRVARPGGSELRIVFSGDIGRFDVPLHLDPQPCPGCDVLVVESTYGDRLHETETVEDQVAGPFAEVLGRGGTILVPAFAVGRTQQVTLVLRRLMKAGRIPEVPIHIDSPMAINATRVYSRFLDRRNVDADVFEDGRLRLFPERVHFHRTVAESKRLNELDGPRIVVSASGMLTAGRVLHHLKRLAPDPKNLVILPGYQAEGTRGRRLKDGERTIKVHGQRVPVRARVLSLHGLSGHADRDELLRWVESAPERPRRVFVVHGEPGPAASFGELLRGRLGAEVTVPAIGDSFEL